MTQTETALMIASGVMVLFGVPFFSLASEAWATDNQAVMVPISIMGFLIIGFCALVLITGAWLDGLCN